LASSRDSCSSSVQGTMSLEVQCFSAILRLCGWRCMPAHAMQAEMHDLECRDRAGRVTPTGLQSAPRSEKQRGAGFSLANFSAVFAKRCAHSPPAIPGCPEAVVLSAKFGDVKHTAAMLLPCLSDEKFADSDLEYLSSLFRSRDSGRMQETVLPIARLLWAKDVENAKHLLVLARDGLLALTEEAWHLLQQRHPGVQPDLAKPDGTRLSSRTLGSPSLPPKKASICSTASGTTAWDSSIEATSPLRKIKSLSGAPGPWKSGTDPESLSIYTASTRDCSLRTSRTTFASTPSHVATGKDRLLKVVSIDEEGPGTQSFDEDEPEDEPGTPVQERLLKVADIGEDEPWFGSLSAYSVCDCPCAGRGKGAGRSGRNEVWSPHNCDHRLEWELQFMLTGALDEVFQSLLHNTSNAAVGNATSRLEKAREDVLEWTVKRWNTCVR